MRCWTSDWRRRREEGVSGVKSLEGRDGGSRESVDSWGC